MQPGHKRGLGTDGIPGLSSLGIEDARLVCFYRDWTLAKGHLGCFRLSAEGMQPKAQGPSPEGHRWEKSLYKLGDGCTVD